MSQDQPLFRFHLIAYAAGQVFEASDVHCDVCTRACAWRYLGNIYAAEEPTVCARCIANGDLARFLGDEDFTLHDVIIDSVDPDLRMELLQRTPGVTCFNPFEWPVIDGMPMAFIGHGDDAIVCDDVAAQDALEAACNEAGAAFDRGAADPSALLFRQVDGLCYRAVIDLD